MGRISLKVLIYAVSFALGLIALSGCVMEPVSLTNFVEDEDVIDIIDKGAGTVIIVPNNPEPDLIAGNGKISGLDPNKYYMVEEWAKNGDPIGEIKFVSSSGKLGELTGIGRASAGEITGLTNSHQYRVKSSQILTGTVPYTSLAGLLGGDTSKQNAAIIEGAIILKPPDGGYLVFTPPPSVPINNYDINSCDIVKAPVNPPGPTASVSLLSNGDIFAEAPAETEADYVFYDNVIKALYTLKVIILDENTEPPKPPEPGVNINITLSLTGDSSPQVGQDITYTQNDTGTVNIDVTDPSQYDDSTVTGTTYDGTGINWFFDGVYKSTGASFALNKGAIEYKIIGVHLITVEALKEGIPYSTTIRVTVLP
jgi:hypothetical protein